MRIEVSDLPGGGKRFAGTMALELPAGRDWQPVTARRPVAYGFWAIRDGSDLHVRGWVSTTLEATCARCLRGFPHFVRQEFELVYADVQQMPRQQDLELDPGQLGLDYYGDDGIEVSSMLAEQLLLALPMKLLCSGDCRGLCSRCGVNLNLRRCDCRPVTDPRLAALADIRERL